MNRLVILFFVSGAAGLVYESIWSRELHRIFGTSQFAIATVLAAFMTGLAAGGAIGARHASRVSRPLRAYAILEAGIGAFALIFPLLLDAIEPLYLGFWHAFSPSVVSFGVFQFLVLGVVLLLPTAAMGATLPLLVRLPVAEGSLASAGRLYAVNTAGAVFGTWLAGFYLLPGIGVFGTTLLAACVNFALAAVAWRLDRQLEEESRVEAENAPAPVEPISPGAESSPWPWYLIAALAGFSSLALEVAWFRLLTLILGASTYAFTVMLLAFLVGIAIGGEGGAGLAQRFARRDRAWLGVVVAQLAVALLTFGAMFRWRWLPLTFVKAYFAIEPMADTLLWPTKCLIAVALMAPPALFMGATFPMLVAALRSRDLSRSVGGIYSANTVGALLGAFLAGFVLLPQFQVRGTVIACIAVNLGAALAAFLSRPRSDKEPVYNGAAGLVVGLLAFVVAKAAPPWEPMLMTTGVYKYVDNLAEPTQAEIQRDMIDRYEMLFYAEGLSTVVTVARNKKTGNVWLANNGKIDASSTTDMPTQILVTHLPFAFTAGRAQKAVVIGLASGITLGAATLHRELKEIDVVEIEPRIREATEFFRPWNHDALDDPRVNLIANDGRNQLLLTPPGAYDVIVCEPSNPWLTGVSNLFTREFFEMGKARLSPGGVWAQWVQMYGMDNRDLRAVMKTFATVFPYVHVFATIEDADLVMVGSDSPMPLSPEAFEALRSKDPVLTRDMDTIELTDRWLMLSTWLFDRDTLLEFAGEVPLNTDDNLLVEFSAPRNLHKETSTRNFRDLRRFPRIPSEALHTVDDHIALARAYEKREQLPRALMALAAAEKLDPTREGVRDLRAAYETMLLSQ